MYKGLRRFFALCIAIADMASLLPPPAAMAEEGIALYAGGWDKNAGAVETGPGGTLFADVSDITFGVRLKGEIYEASRYIWPSC